MPVINPNTLFHFTPKIQGLKGILSQGLRMSYCYEEFTRNLGIALPLICFCDIPLLRTLNHRAVYGNYMVGFDKEYMINQCQPFLNPVNYLKSLFIRNLGDESFKTLWKIISNIYPNEIRRILEEAGIQSLTDEHDVEDVFAEDENLKYKRDQISFVASRLRYSLAFSKEYSTTRGGKEIINYNEREWRYINNYWNDDENKENWKVAISSQEFESKKISWNKELWAKPNAYITIQPQNIIKAVKFIVVKKESQVRNIVSYIRKSKQLFGMATITEEQKEILISRILSFEIIEKNF